MAGLKLYLLKRNHFDYDDVACDHGEVAAMVVAASELWPARELAAAAHGLEPASEWDAPNWSTCELIGTAVDGTEPGVVYTDTLGA